MGLIVVTHPFAACEVLVLRSDQRNVRPPRIVTVQLLHLKRFDVTAAPLHFQIRGLLSGNQLSIQGLY